MAKNTNLPLVHKQRWAMNIKKGDWVVVAGEANECFRVIAVDKNYVSIHTACREPIHKCTKVPRGTKINKVTSYYCDLPYPGKE